MSDEYFDKLKAVITKTRDDVKEILKAHPMLIQAAVAGRRVSYCPRHNVLVAHSVAEREKHVQNTMNKWGWKGQDPVARRKWAESYADQEQHTLHHRNSWMSGNKKKTGNCRGAIWSRCTDGDPKGHVVYPFAKEMKVDWLLQMAEILTEMTEWKEKRKR